ncbi:Outer membrane protein TolC [Tenacibaculum sp. 190524A02b]|uniref:Outer membrane protein TolC n=1 Tax=Tenacibaculum vairaonense TaxID=3137860 RepID=A0ABP1F900_9FLAO
MKKFLSFLLFISTVTIAQTPDILSLEEYIGYVKKYHPILKQAQLITSNGEAKLLKARGAFDPKIEVDYNRKKFKKSEYYNKLNTTFKIPTWYGIEFKANYETNSGIYLNPELKTPKNGLYSAGVSISLARGLLTNKRMVTLRKAKLYNKQSIEQQKLAINQILFDAINVYFKWLKNYQTQSVYGDYLTNAKVRLTNIKKSFYAGDKPAIDTLEANINYKNRVLDLEKSKLSYTKSKLELSNFLWLNNNLPLELKNSIIPDINTLTIIDTVLDSSISKALNFNIEVHPKLKQLNLKKESLLIEKRLQLNKLLPKVDLQYNFLSADYRNINSFNTSNYKGALQISFPLFLRKERGNLKLAKLKVKDIDFDITATKVALQNKIKATITEINSYNEQNRILNDLVNDYSTIVNSEERKFSLGEGSLFLINYREVKLIESKLKLIKTQNELFIAKSTLVQLLNNFKV